RDRIVASQRSTTGWRREDAGGPRGRRGRGGRGRGGPPPRGREAPAAGAAGAGRAAGLPVGVAGRAQVIDRLDREGLLPAITFIFSRVGCDSAVQQLLASGTRLVDDTESRAIRRLV